MSNGPGMKEDLILSSSASFDSLFDDVLCRGGGQHNRACSTFGPRIMTFPVAGQ